MPPCGHSRFIFVSVSEFLFHSMDEIKDQRAEAMKYLERHRILKLFDLLGAKLVKRKPDNPNEFLVSELEKILESKTLNQPVYNNIISIF